MCSVLVALGCWAQLLLMCGVVVCRVQRVCCCCDASPCTWLHLCWRLPGLCSKACRCLETGQLCVSYVRAMAVALCTLY